VLIDYESYGYISFRGNIWWYLFMPMGVLCVITILMAITSIIVKSVCTTIDYLNQDCVFIDFYRIYTNDFNKLKRKIRN